MDGTGAEGPMLAVNGLRYAVADRVLLDGVDLKVSAGESAAVVGPSGSGKSTLLGCLMGLIRPSGGSVRVAGSEITKMRQRVLERHRSKHMGVVFQFGELLPELSPVENVALAALLGGTGARQAYQRAEEILGELNVPHREVPTMRLSGGERQRTAVARALINEPSVLLADEPTGALDTGTRDSVADVLFAVAKDRGCALVVVTHDAEVAGRADRCWALDGSRLVQRGLGVS
ncbi:ABC transporter ATP-binding protein [Streptomyces sp. NPDC006530]|uniref:ABC transporter ATP-binding protein n=1 Tax=Streptomyces sp. NPDC006530 TaxID=3364750 RepID=UPI00367B4448